MVVVVVVVCVVFIVVVVVVGVLLVLCSPFCLPKLFSASFCTMVCIDSIEALSLSRSSAYGVGGGTSVSLVVPSSKAKC